MTSLKYSVIEFVPDPENNKEEEILMEVVPTKWITENKEFCYYPPHSMRGKSMKLVMGLADYDSSYELFPIKYHHSYSTFNVALKALNKAVKKDTIATTDIDTDYSKPRNRKPSKRLLSSDSDEEPREKKTLKSQNIPGPSLTLPSKFATLFDNIKAKNVTTPKQQKSVSSKVWSIPSKKDTTSISQLFESAQSETTNDENLPEKMARDNSSSKLKPVSKNDGFSLKTTKFSNNIKLSEIVEETDTHSEQSSDSNDMSTLRYYHDNMRINKKKNVLDIPTSSKNLLEDLRPSTSGNKSCGSAGNKPQDQVILNYMQELSAKMDWQSIGLS